LDKNSFEKIKCEEFNYLESYSDYLGSSISKYAKWYKYILTTALVRESPRTFDTLVLYWKKKPKTID
jgi:hypothetical protein